MSYTIYDILTRLEQVEDKKAYIAYLRQLCLVPVLKTKPCAIVAVNTKLSEQEPVARAVSFGDD